MNASNLSLRTLSLDTLMNATGLGRTFQRMAAALVLLFATWIAFSPLHVRADKVMNFGGTSPFVLPTASALKFGASNDFALELWLKPQNTTTETAAIFTADNLAALTAVGTNGGWGLYWKSGGLVVIRKPSTSATNPNALGGSEGALVGVTAGVWHHVVVNFQRTGVLTFYVDGVLKETGNDSFASWAYFQRTFDSAIGYRLGMDPDGTKPFKGAVDEVRIWSRLRTAGEVSNAYQNKLGLTGTESGLIAYYNFNDVNPAACSGSLGRNGDATTTPGPATEDATLAIQAALVPSPGGDYAFSFLGVNQSIETEITGDQLAGNELTVEYWFKGSRLQSAVRLQVDTKWFVSGWGSGPFHIINTTGTNNVQISVNRETEPVTDGKWHHIAVTWKSGTVGGFQGYRDGISFGSGNTTAHPFPAINAKVWIGSLNGGSEYLTGELDEVRIWNRALSAAEIKSHADAPARLFGKEPGLVAYFPFNDGSALGTKDEVSGKLATFRNMGTSERVIQSGLKFAEPVVIRNPNPASAGLWLGEVSLKSVNEVTGSQANQSLTSPAGGTFDFNVLFHVDATGTVKLLKDVTIMQKRNSASNLTEIVLLTDDKLIPNYEGVLKRNGKMVGVRYSSAFYQFAGQSLSFNGGIGMFYALNGTNVVAADLPTSPFVHKYHPQHKKPLDLQGQPYQLTRAIDINLIGGGRTSPEDGRDRIRGTYKETITGLHRLPLITEGEISLERVSLVNTLNAQ